MRSIIMVFLALLACDTTQALDLTFVPKIETGTMYYKFESEPGFYANFDADGNVLGISDPTTTTEYSDIVPYIEGGGTLGINRFYLDFDIQHAFNGTDENDRLILASPLTNGRLRVQQRTYEWSRMEYNLTGGYRITDWLSLFAGYTWADKDSYSRRVFRESLEPALDNPVPIATPIRDTGDVNVTTRTRGPFLGASFGTPIGKSWYRGFLNGSIAVASLGAYVTQERVDDDGQFFYSTSNGGDTIGIKIGAGWTGYITDNLLYTINADYYQYDYTADRDKLIDDGRIRQRQGFSETIMRTSIGLKYLF